MIRTWANINLKLTAQLRSKMPWPPLTVDNPIPTATNIVEPRKINSIPIYNICIVVFSLFWSQLYKQTTRAMLKTRWNIRNPGPMQNFNSPTLFRSKGKNFILMKVRRIWLECIIKPLKVEVLINCKDVDCSNVVSQVSLGYLDVCLGKFLLGC